MSERQRFVMIKKDVSNIIRNMSPKQLLNYMRINNPDVVYDSGEKDEIEIYSFFLNGIYDFGYFLDSDKINGLGEDYFKNKETAANYARYDIKLLDGRKALEYAISHMQDEIIERYNNLLKLKEDETYEDKLKQEVEKKTQAWDMFKDFQKDGSQKKGPHVMNLNRDTICDSTFIEYEIFELVRIYKTFDYDSYDIVYIYW